MEISNGKAMELKTIPIPIIPLLDVRSGNFTSFPIEKYIESNSIPIANAPCVKPKCCDMIFNFSISINEYPTSYAPNKKLISNDIQIIVMIIGCNFK